MNYFRVPYRALLEAVRTVPEHPVRKEKELPVALSNWSQTPLERPARAADGEPFST